MRTYFRSSTLPLVVLLCVEVAVVATGRVVEGLCVSAGCGGGEAALRHSPDTHSIVFHLIDTNTVLHTQIVDRNSYDNMFLFQGTVSSYNIFLIFLLQIMIIF